MVTNNKVLTVSYGTFSCTLEGFEDSFDTMKAIAEYFRDLAADDRYFGAEPPTPDAEMLARIAEREIERRVQARVDHGAIVLSAAAATSPAAAEATVAAPVEDAKAPAPDQPVSKETAEAAEAIDSDDTELAVAATLTDEAAPAPQPKSEDIAIAPEVAETDFGADSDDDTVETVMSRAAEEVSETEAPVAEEPVAPTIEAPVSEEPEDALEMAAPAEIDDSLPEAEDIAEIIDDAAQELEEAETLEDDILEDDIFAEAEEDIAPVAAEDAAEAEDAFADWDDEEDDVDPEYEVNSIAAKLERIRAVVSRVEEEPEDDFSEDEHAEDVAAEDTFLADTVHQVEEALAADDQPGDTPQPLRARVVRMKRADFEEAVASGLLEAEPVEDDEDDAMSAADGSSLSPEDEAELLAELAEVEAELDVLSSYEDDTDATETEDDTAAEDRTEAEDEVEDEVEDTSEPFILTDAVDTSDEDPAPKASEQLAEATGGGDDLSRLMAKAESEMQEPVGKGRRQAIAHLRAAVKATKAEKEAGNDVSRRDHSEAYRDDLASVVRAVPGGASADKPRERSEAPLKLVAAQRVDAPAPAPERDPAPEVAEAPKAPKAAEPTPDAAPRAPVRPRRVSAERIDREEIARNAAPVGTSAKVQGDFQAYATSVGATRLPEVLEAAAAYLTFVEGHDRFSRPMLMRMARDANEDEFSREIGLRSFGQLLREKKIEKIAGGRFTAKPSIGFKPDDRAVG